MKKSYIISLLFFLLIRIFTFSQTPPVATNDSNTAELNTTLSATAPGVLTNDTDADGDTLTVTSFIVNGTTYSVGQTANLAQGNITVDADGSYLFSPATGFLGSFPAITYTITDGTNSDTATLNLTVQNTTNLNPPIANTDVDTADINTTLNVNAPGLLANDTDADGDTLTITQFTVSGTTYSAGQTANLPEGNLTINADGSYTFVPTPGYIGPVPNIFYTLSDGLNTATGLFLLTVEPTTNLLEIELLASCNQGYTVDGDYKIKYNLTLTNRSNARDYHANSLITNIDIIDDLNAIFGNNCPTLVDQTSVSMLPTIDYVNNPYPQDWNSTSFNSNFENLTSPSIFDANAIATNVLYPRQTINVGFCVTVNPFCGGRPNPTPSSSGINFDNIIDITSSTDNVSSNYLLTDFHTSEAIVTANLYVPEPSPAVNPDGTYDFTNTVIITNEYCLRLEGVVSSKLSKFPCVIDLPN